MSRRYPERPVLGVGALIFRRDRILLVERGNEPLKGLWSLPGGALETGERLEEGICREVLEETGLVVKPVGLATIFERIMPDAAGRTEYHYVLVDYVCRVLSGEARPATDVSQVAWVREGDLGQYRLTEGTLEVIRAAYKARKRRRRTP